MRTSSHVGQVRLSTPRPECSGRSSRAAALGVVAALFLCALLSLLTSTDHAAFPVPVSSTTTAIRLSSSFALADFDGDRQPDLATAEVEHATSHLTRYLIRLRLQAGGAGASQSIGVTGSFGLPHISALDVNGDHVPDLVLTASGQQRLIAVLLNDGRGRFSVANPSEFPLFLEDSPWRWRPAIRHLHDIAALVLAQSPQAEAPQQRDNSAPPLPKSYSVPSNPGFVTDALGSGPSGRAPPLVS